MCSRYGIDEYTAEWLQSYFRHAERFVAGDVRPGNPAPILIGDRLAVLMTWGLPRKGGLIINAAPRRLTRNSPHAGDVLFRCGISTNGTRISSESLFVERRRRYCSSRASIGMIALPSSPSQLMILCARFMTACPCRLPERKCRNGWMAAGSFRRFLS